MTNHHLEPSALFAALSDGSRCRMVERLSRGPATVSELALPLGISMPTVLQHLKILEASGLVATRKAGRVRSCRLAPGALDQVASWIEARRDAWASSLAQLESYLAEDAAPEEDLEI